MVEPMYSEASLISCAYSFPNEYTLNTKDERYTLVLNGLLNRGLFIYLLLKTNCYEARLVPDNYLFTIKFSQMTYSWLIRKYKNLRIIPSHPIKRNSL